MPGSGPGGLGGRDVAGDTPATEELAVVMVLEAMVAWLMVGGTHNGGPWLEA